MAEGARLEIVYVLTGIEGSNPSLSARCCVTYCFQTPPGPEGSNGRKHLGVRSTFFDGFNLET